VSGTLTGGIYVTGANLKLSGPVTTNAAEVTLEAGGQIIEGTTNALTGLSANSGSLTLGTSLTLTGSLTNTGTVTLTAGTLATSTYSQSGGTTSVGTPATLSAGGGAGTVTITAGTLAGSGKVLGAVRGSGKVQPKGTAGPLRVTGTYASTATGSLAIGIAAPKASATGAGQLVVSGTATLAGALVITTTPGYVPPVGTTYTVLSASSVSGTFATLTGQIDQPAGVYYTVSYTGTAVVLTVHALPTLSIAGATITAPTSGTSVISFAVTLSGPSPFATSVTYTTVDGTAIAGVDYTAVTGKLTIPAGKTTGTIKVTVLAQTVTGPTTTFSVDLSAPKNTTVTTPSAIGTLLNPIP